MQTQQVLTKFDPVKAQLAEAVQEAKALSVTDDPTKETALKVGKNISSVEKNISATYKKVTQEARDFVKTCKDYEKSLLAQTEPAKKHIRQQLLQYEQKLKKEREEMERKLAEEKRKAEEEAKAMAAKDVTPQAPSWDNLDQDHENLKAQAEIDRQVELDAMNAQREREFKRKQKEIEANKVKGTQKVWNYKITDESKLPRDFMSPDPKKIREFMRAKDLNGQGRDWAPIPGIEFFQEERVTFR